MRRVKMMRKYMFNFLIAVFCIIGCATTQPQVQVTEKPKKVDINTVISQLSQQISSTMLEQNKRRVAVMNFTLQTGEMTELGLYLSDKLTNSLFQYRDKFEVVERTRLESALKEMKLGLTGIIDDKTVQSIGKVLGADAIVIGSITNLGKEIDINVRMLGTEKANVLAVASSFLEKDEVISRLIRNVRVIEPDSTKPQAKTETITPSPKPEVLPKVEVKDFIFEARGCKREGQNKVRCHMAVTNNLQNTRTLIVLSLQSGKSLLVDDMGNQYQPVGKMFGGRTQNKYDGEIMQELPPSLPMNLALSYEGVVPEAKSVSVIVDCFLLNSELFKAVLRNIPLSR